NVSRKAIKEGIENVLKIPGRFEIIDGGPYYKATVVVDYAHTPDSLEKVIKTAKEVAEAKVITVFGCGGDRDTTKRPEMGEVAARLSDFTILTSDNPRSEEPEKIIDEIEAGVKKVKEANYICLINRHEAISAAIKMAKKGDFVIIAGKGHEKGQIFKNKVLPFSDQEVASEAMRRFSSCSI
ncbi:MAG: cyanophycin synthetase, partial [Candidatus Subteraquimicrobiales bacterium]|nr:cyanophycin synthetase [Candidatus Subteraquimicrobiales bacterium]